MNVVQLDIYITAGKNSAAKYEYCLIGNLRELGTMNSLVAGVLPYPKSYVGNQVVQQRGCAVLRRGHAMTAGIAAMGEHGTQTSQ